MQLNRPSFSLTLPNKDSSTKGGQNNNLLSDNDKDLDNKSDVDKNLVNEYQKETFHVNDDIKVKITDVSNNGGGIKNELNDSGYHYDKPLITTAEPEILDRTYLPPKEFIPPANREYLPPIGFKPPTSDY